MVKSYKNGSYRVDINTETGTRVIIGDPRYPEFPDSIDLKITDRCQYGCPFCSESSGPSGRHASLQDITRFFDRNFPIVPIEIAVGGGSVSENPEFTEIIKYLVDRGFIVNVTMSIPEALKTDLTQLDISGLGISLGDASWWTGDLVQVPGPKQVVYHAIAGITPVAVIQELLRLDQRVLVLGYKNRGRALVHELPEMSDLEVVVKSWIHDSSEDKTGTLAFDCLGAEQLKISGAILEKDWDVLWQGKDFTHTMFIDAVTGTLCPSSSVDRSLGVHSTDVLSYFTENHDTNIN